MNKRERRKRYFVKSGLQLRYLGLILIAIILPVVLFVGCLYYLIFYLMAQQLGIPESIAYNLIPVLHKINLIILLGVPLISLVILIWGVFISHRIAGPIYRLEKDLERIAAGDFSWRIRLRSKDELHSVAKGINKILEKIGEKN